MNHQQAQMLLSAFFDGQTGGLRRFFLRRHFNRCPSCLAELDALQSMRTAAQTHLTVHRAPPGLASRIGLALPREAPPPPRTRRMPPLRFGGAALAGMLVGVALTLTVMRTPDPLVADVVADHVRSLMAEHLTDVLSSDQHTVKPWLSARLDLSPVVKDLTAEGFPLIGGRLDYVAGHHAAALVYRRARHVINLFAFVSDSQASATPTLETRDGFNVARWRMGGLTYAAVSDVEAAQLLAFARLVEGG